MDVKQHFKLNVEPSCTNNIFRIDYVEATFQRDMDIDFEGLINRSVVVYLYDVIIYSMNQSKPLQHIKQNFEI